MSYETLIYGLSADIATVALDRPEARNGLNSQMRYDLLHAVKRAEGEARCLVLTGRGAHFCAGQDLTGDGRIASLDLERVLREEYMPLLQALQDCRIPVIAGVNGTASGSGAVLALTADIVVAKRSASFTFTAARIGMFSEFGASYALPRQIGFARAMGAVMLGEGNFRRSGLRLGHDLGQRFLTMSSIKRSMDWLINWQPADSCLSQHSPGYAQRAGNWL